MHGELINDSIGTSSGRPSLILQQSIDDDILSILRNSEARNWDALDLILKGVNEHSEKISSLRSQCDEQAITALSSLDNLSVQMIAQNEKLNDVLRSIDSHNITPIASPLLDTIFNTNSQQNELHSSDSFLLTRNPLTVNTANKEAMIPNKIEVENVPKTSNLSRQKMQKHISPGEGPGIEQTTSEMSSGTLTDNNDDTSSTQQLENHVLNAMENIDLSNNRQHDNRSTSDVRVNDTINHESTSSSASSTAQEVPDEASVVLQAARQPPSSSTSNNAQEVADVATVVLQAATQPSSSSASSTAQAVAEEAPVELLAATQPSTKLKNEFHLSRIINTATCDMVKFYMQNMGITDLSHTKVQRLVSHKCDVTTLSYISFKIDTNDEIASIISESNFWPQHTTFKRFIHKKPPAVDISNVASPFPRSRTPNSQT